MLSRSKIRARLVAATLLIAGLPFLSSSYRATADGPDKSHFPNIELITQDGKKVHFFDDLIKGKIVAIDMIYTTCQYACPLETARMAQVQKKLGDRVGQDIFFYSITIDPAHDTPDVLKAYMEKYHIGPGWTFLTGKKEDIDFLSKRLGLYSNPSINADGHLPHLLIGNETTGEWIRGSALDNPSFQARMIGEFLDNFKHLKKDEPQSSADGSPLQNFDRGKYLFGRDCVACHSIGRGNEIGPDLLGVTRTRDHAWLVRMIQQPEQLLNEKDPLAMSLLAKSKDIRMPNLNVSDAEVEFLLQYIETQTQAHEKQAAATAKPNAGNVSNQPK
jgi:protein SCO1/2